VKTKASLAIAMASILTSGCTYQAVATASMSPASEVRVDRIRDTHALVVTNFSDTELTKEARKPGVTCTANKYPLELGPALRQSIGIVMESSFASYEMSNDADDRATYQFLFDVREFDPMFTYSSGFWSGTAQGTVNLSARVTVLDRQGSEILRTTISGTGNSTAEGACDKGSEALSMAGTNAISDMLENFVLRVINSDELDR
jgi:hypothetical protein